MFITNTNFETISDTTIVYNKYVKDNVVYLTVKEDEIIIATDYAVVPCWYYIKKDDNFILTDDIIQIEKFCKENAIVSTPNRLAISYYGLNHKKGAKTYKIGYKYIEDYKEIHLKPNGDYSIIPFGFKAFYKEPKDSYDQISQLFKKYKSILDEMIKDGVFRPTLTGGLDSRTLIGLYRDHIHELDSYYLLDVKNDGLNSVRKGQDEIQLAQRVVEYLGCNWKKVDNLTDRVTLTSHLNENQCQLKASIVNNYKDFWVDKVVRHYKNNKNTIRWLMDPLYLELKIPCFTFYKCLFAMLLIPDLIENIPLISLGGVYDKHGAYNFYGQNYEARVEAEKVMNYWGKANCDNILK